MDKLNEIGECEYYSLTYPALYHTLNKEVGYVDFAYKKTIKKNAAKLRYTEYRRELSRAIDQIHLDIYDLLKNKD